METTRIGNARVDPECRGPARRGNPRIPRIRDIRLNRDRIAVQLDMPDVCITAKEPQVAENLPSETTRIGNA